MARHSDPLRGRRLVWGVVAWLVLGLAWARVVSGQVRTWLPELAIPAIAAMIAVAITTVWVRHNLAIYQRKGPRRGLPAADERWHADSLGRRIELADDVLEANVVRIDLVGDVKRYGAVR